MEGRVPERALFNAVQVPPTVQDEVSTGYAPFVVLYIRRALLILARLAFFSESLAELIAPESWTKTKPDRIPTMAMATKSSISVNDFLGIVYLIY